MAELKGLDALETLRKTLAIGEPSGAMPYNTLKGMSEAPNQFDQEAETYGALANVGKGSPTFAGGLIEGFGTGVKMSKKEKAQAERDVWRKKTEELATWDIDRRQWQAELERVGMIEAQAKVGRIEQQSAIDEAVRGVAMGSGSGFVTVVNSDPRLKAAAELLKPEGGVQLVDALERNGGIVPVWRNEKGEEVFGGPIPMAEFASPQTVQELIKNKNAAAMGELDMQKTQAEIEKIRADAQGGGIKPPSGYRATPEGNLEVIPGGPAFQKQEFLSEKERANQNAGIAQADRLIMKVDQALGNVSGFTSGIGEAIQPGFVKRLTGASDLNADLETIKANLGFAELQAMREASPTGGALGQVAVQELIALQSTISSLDQAQSPDQLRARLGEVRKHYENWKKAVMDSRNEGGEPQNQLTSQPQRQVFQTPQASEIKAAYQAGRMTKEQARAALQQLGGQ